MGKSLPTIARVTAGAFAALGCTALACAGTNSLSVTALDGTNGMALRGAFGPSQAGSAVAVAGDLDDDGRNDVLIGSLGATGGGSLSGAAYIIPGRSTPLPATIELFFLGSDGTVLPGAAAGDFAGISVGAAGDVNGDGIEDLIVGAYAADPNGSSSGASYVVFGVAGPLPAAIDLGALDGTNGFALNGITSPDRSGRSVSAAGDLDHDGIDDLAVGAYNASPNGPTSGTVYVVFGARTFPAAVELATLDGTNGFAVYGIDEEDQLGIAVAAGGDVNDDGIDDLLIGASEACPNGFNSGAVYVIYGRATAFPGVIEAAALDGVIGAAFDGPYANAQVGLSVAGPGDVDGDGIDDLLIGAPGAHEGGPDSGAAWLVYGRSGFPANTDLNGLGPMDGTTIAGPAAGADAGTGVAGAGDFDGDGHRDLVIGAAAAGPAGEGAAYVIFGGPRGGGPIDLGTVATSGVGLQLAGALPGDEFGYAVGGGGDLDGDGLDDIVIGAPGSDVNGNGSGTAYVVLGSGDCNGNGLTDAVDIASGASADADGDGIPDECGSCADVDGDGTVGLGDLLLVLSSWGRCAGACPEDLDDSGAVDLADLLLVLSSWGLGC